jgi:hypothetical protein
MLMRSFAILLGVLTLVTGAASQEQTGTVIITVVDASGAVLPGAAVTLAGLTERGGTADSQGRATFNDLAPGAYTASATLPGFVKATTRVEVTAGGTAVHRIGVVLGPLEWADPNYPKPRSEGLVTGCDLPPPATLRGIVRAVDAIVRLKVTGQHAEDHPNVSGKVVTINNVQVMATFKSDRKRRPVVSVLRHGGEIDRGTSIHLLQTGDSPLIVGREYVVFLKYDEYYRAWRASWCGKSTVPVDTRLLEPHGEAGFADKWRGKPVSEFLTALRRETR